MSLAKLTSLFFDGLNRNFKIIRYGDVPNVYKSDVHQERYGFAGPGIKGYLLSIKELARHLLRPTLKIYTMPSSGVLYCGGSANNEREFLFFSQLISDNRMSIPGYERNHNLSFVPSQELRKTLGERLLSLLLLFYCCLYLSRIKLGPTALKYLIVYAKVFAQVFSSVRRQSVSAGVAVVANDHTDFPVVASMVMKYFSVPVVYVQHAEISRYFPPLDFDVSILRNHKTLDRYREIGEISGEVFIIPRREKDESFDRIFRARSSKTAVVIYLSSVFDVTELRKCVAVLQKNSDVLSVGVKPHPRSDCETLRCMPGVSVYDSIPPVEHVAIAPNSSVVVELLERGVPVFQYFKLDDVGSDYYGFVEEGIACAVTADELATRFWQTDFYGDEWAGRFAQFSPSVDESWRESVPVLVSRIERFLRSGSGS